MTYRLMFVVFLEYFPSEIVALSSLPSSISRAICSPSDLNVNTAVIAPKIEINQINSRTSKHQSTDFCVYTNNYKLNGWFGGNYVCVRITLLNACLMPIQRITLFILCTRFALMLFTTQIIFLNFFLLLQTLFVFCIVRCIEGQLYAHW